MAGQIHDDGGQSLSDVAQLCAEAGDVAGAMKMATLVNDAYYKRYAQSAVAEAQLKAGDRAGAQKTLIAAKKTAELIKNVYGYYALTDVAEGQRAAGDIVGAKETLTAALTGL